MQGTRFVFHRRRHFRQAHLLQRFVHRQADALPVAAQFTAGLLAAQARFLAALGHGDRPFDGRDHLGHADFPGRPPDLVAAAGAAVGVEQAASGQQFQYFAGRRHLDTDTLRQRMGTEHLAVPGQFHHHQDGVICQLRNP